MDKRIALVTGGSQGIGRCLCIKLTGEGYEVFSASRSKSLPEDMAGITQIPVDFSSTDQTINFAKDFIDQYGVPDLLVNNAGYGAFYEWGEYPDSEITKQFDVLLSSPIRLCRIFAPAMQKKGRGVILNVSSLATLFPLPFMPMYNAAKSALSSFTESMILEYQKFPKFIDFFSTKFKIQPKIVEDFFSTLKIFFPAESKFCQNKSGRLGRYKNRNEARKNVLKS